MKYFLVAVLNFFTCVVLAQGFRVRHSLPSMRTSYSKAIFETSQGNYITGGLVIDSVTGASQLCVLGLNSTGQLLWSKKYGRTKFQYLHNPFAPHSFYKQGNFLYYAGIALDSNNKYVGVFIKFNFNGDTLWQTRFYEPNDYVYPQMLTGSVDGGFLITGTFDDHITPAIRIMLIKTDAAGKELWRKKIGKAAPNAGDGKAIIQDSATKKIVIAGYQYIGTSNSSTTRDNIVITDSMGTKLSQHNYLNSPGGALYDMIQTKDKKIVAAGYSESAQTIGGYNLQQAYIVKFDLNFPAIPIWTIKNHGKVTLHNTFLCLKELRDSTILLAGLFDSLEMIGAPPNCLVKIAKVKSTGTVTSNRFYNYKTSSGSGVNYQLIKAINLCSDGSWISAIECFNQGVRNPFFFVKYDSTGCDSTLNYCQRFNNTVGIIGSTFNNGAINIFPNPVNTILNVAITNYFETEPLLLLITDLSGRKVKEEEINTSQKEIDTKDLSKGLYILTLSKNKDLLYKAKLVKD